MSQQHHDPAGNSDEAPARAYTRSPGFAERAGAPDYLARIHAVIGPLLPPGSEVALFDFPHHPNVGDSAIWLGEERYLANELGARLVAVDVQNRSLLPVLPPETVILIHGGGNLGDLWPDHQAFRERIIASYPDHRVIQLPQSIHFQQPAAFERCRQAFNGHPDFHLLVRDHVSLALATHLHDGPSHLCPDMALAIAPFPRTAAPRQSLFGLLRADKERAVTAMPVASDLVVADWMAAPPTGVARLATWVDQLQCRYPRRLARLYAVKRRLYHRIARQHLKRGCDMLCSGQVVITDRLHGHILCALMGIPHVVLDNCYRKIGNFRDAWDTGAGLCVQADTPLAALQAARQLLAQTGGHPTVPHDVGG